MGCCWSEPIHNTIETQSIPENFYFQRRPRSTSFYIKNNPQLKSYEDKVLIATLEAYEEDSNIY